MSTHSTSDRSRQPKGIPTGGQFAAESKDDTAGSLVETPERAFPDTPDTFTRRYDSVEEKVEAFKAELHDAVASLDTDENWKKYLDVMGRFHRYSPTNQMLILIQTKGEATRVAGFRVWQGMGRHVNKGEKAIGIFAPVRRWVTEKDAKGNPVRDENGKLVKRKVVTGFTTASVFDIAQTDGDPLPQIEEYLSEEPPDGLVDDLQTAIAEQGYTVEFRDVRAEGAPEGLHGWTSPREKKVVVDSAMPPGSVAKTLAHELGHIECGHCEPDAAGSYHVGPGGCRGRMEVEAESVAYVLSRANGMSPGTAKVSSTYVAGWARTAQGEDVLRTSADTVSKAVNRLLAPGRFRHHDDAEKAFAVPGGSD